MKRFALSALTANLLLWTVACEPASEEDERGPKPEVVYEWYDAAAPDLLAQSGTFPTQFCSVSVQSETEGQYVIDFRNLDEGVMLRLRFPETQDAAPEPGTYVVSVDVLADFTLPSPYGVMNGTAGGVLIQEEDGWYKVTVSAEVDNGGAEGGHVDAILACGI